MQILRKLGRVITDWNLAQSKPAYRNKYQCNYWKVPLQNGDNNSNGKIPVCVKKNLS